MDALDVEIQVLTTAGLTDDEVLSLCALRLRAERGDLEWTQEFKAVIFMYRLYHSGRIGRGDNYSSGLLLRDLPVVLDFAGVGAQIEPAYRGGGC